MDDGEFTELVGPVSKDLEKKMEERVKDFPSEMRKVLDENPDLQNVQLHLTRYMVTRFADLIEAGYLFDDQKNKAGMH